MTTRTIYLFIIFGLFVSCNSKTQNTSQQFEDSEDEMEIVNLVFDATVGHDTIWSKQLLIPPVFLPPGGHQTKEDRLEYENYSKSIDSLKLKLDTAKLYVFINDSLISFPENRNRVKSMTEYQPFKLNFPETDTAFRQLLVKLIDSTISKPLDILKLKSIYNYKVDYISNRNNYSNSIIKIGKVTISRPAFSKDLKRACIYSEIICGGECGGGSIIFLRKVNGQWKIEGQRELWVS